MYLKGHVPNQVTDVFEEATDFLRFPAKLIRAGFAARA